METLPELLVARFRAWHGTALKAVDGATDAQLRWRPADGPQCLLWQLWHIARWDDRFAEIVAEHAGLRHEVPREQVWHQDGVRARWRWQPEIELGRRDSGTGLSDEQAAALPFPGLDAVRDYATRAFERAEAAVAAIDPDTMHQPAAADNETWASNALQYLEHVPEHVAVMNVLRTLQRLPPIDA